MQITIIGAGNVGAALGKGWARAGHIIVYGVPNPDDPRHDQAAAAAGGARLATVGEAVQGTDAIVLAVPWDAVPAAIAACGDLSGRLLIDVTNPLRIGTDGIELALGFDRSGGETVAELVKGARVIKTLNQVGYEVMADSSGYAVPPVMFVAGDDNAAKSVVAELIRNLGFNAVDAGELKVARLLEPYAMLWIHQVVARQTPPDNAFAFLRRQH